MECERITEGCLDPGLELPEEIQVRACCQGQLLLSLTLVTVHPAVAQGPSRANTHCLPTFTFFFRICILLLSYLRTLFFQLVPFSKRLFLGK